MRHRFQYCLNSSFQSLEEWWRLFHRMGSDTYSSGFPQTFPSFLLWITLQHHRFKLRVYSIDEYRICISSIQQRMNSASTISSGFSSYAGHSEVVSKSPTWSLNRPWRLVEILGRKCVPQGDPSKHWKSVFKIHNRLMTQPASPSYREAVKPYVQCMDKSRGKPSLDWVERSVSNTERRCQSDSTVPQHTTRKNRVDTRQKEANESCSSHTAVSADQITLPFGNTTRQSKTFAWRLLSDLPTVSWNLTEFSLSIEQQQGAFSLLLVLCSCRCIEGGKGKSVTPSSTELAL